MYACYLSFAGGFHSPGLDPGHPDLVLYYKFDEGQGYVVRDVTGKGHDLKITQPPQWEVGAGTNMGLLNRSQGTEVSCGLLWFTVTPVWEAVPGLHEPDGVG